MAETKIRATCTSSYDKKVFYKISNQSDERCKRSFGDKIGQTEGWTKGRMDRWTHTRMEEGHFYSKRSCGDKIRQTEERNDGPTHTRMDKGHFYSSPKPSQVTKMEQQM